MNQLVCEHDLSQEFETLMYKHKHRHRHTHWHAVVVIARYQRSDKGPYEHDWSKVRE
jgi:hypothetical protein